MKYTSLTDILGLSLDEISKLDANGIIRLKKQLKAKAMLGNESNIGEHTKIIDKLNNENERQCYIFVEHHLWLKQLISGHYNEINLSQIDVDDSLIHDEESLKYFLNDYLKENLKVFLADRLDKGNHEHILKVLKHNYLFTEEINQLVINFFRARLDFAKTYISEGKLKDKQYPVGFISKKTFVECLNTYPDSFNEEVQELNSEIIDVYNKNRRRTNNVDFIFTAKAMVALAELDTSNVFLKDNLESNAKIARAYTLSTSNRREKSDSGFSGWSIALVIFLIVRVVIWVSKSSSNDIRPDYNLIDFENISTNPGVDSDRIKSIDSILNEMRSGRANTEDLNNVLRENSESSSNNTASNYDKSKLSNHIRFLYTMKRKVSKKTFSDISPLDLEPFSNPYPRTFNPIPKAKNEDLSVLIKNKTNNDLIVFRLTKGVDQSIFIPENEEFPITLFEQDSVVFYAGKDFVQTRFSHFKTTADLSSMYKVGSYNSEKKEIIVYPFIDKKYNSKSSKRKTAKSYRADKITPKNLKLKRLNIDAIYTDYYNKKYRN